MKAVVIVAAAAALVVMLVMSVAFATKIASGSAGFSIWRSVSATAHAGHYFDTGDVRIYYETYGAGSPVLVLHGGLGSLEDMRHQIRALAATRFVVAADSRGHGRSTDTAAPLRYDAMAADMLHLLDALKIERTDVVGWSDGGIIGLDLAITHPERIRRLVVLGANYDVDGLKDQPLPDANIPRPGRFYRGDADGGEGWPTFYRKVVGMWQTQPHYTLAELGSIKAPTLVMAGEFDVIRREHTDQLARAIPNAEELIIKGGTHFAHAEKPDAVNAEIVRFLDAGR